MRGDCLPVRACLYEEFGGETYSGEVPVHLAREDVVHRDLELDCQNAEDEENGDGWPLRIDGGANGELAKPEPDHDQQNLSPTYNDEVVSDLALSGGPGLSRLLRRLEMRWRNQRLGRKQTRRVYSTLVAVLFPSFFQVVRPVFALRQAAHRRNEQHVFVAAFWRVIGRVALLAFRLSFLAVSAVLFSGHEEFQINLVLLGVGVEESAPTTEDDWRFEGPVRSCEQDDRPEGRLRTGLSERIPSRAMGWIRNERT